MPYNFIDIHHEAHVSYPAAHLEDWTALTRHPPPWAAVLAGLADEPLPPPAEVLRFPLASAACISAATFSCVACSADKAAIIIYVGRPR